MVAANERLARVSQNVQSRQMRFGPERHDPSLMALMMMYVMMMMSQLTVGEEVVS